MSFEIIAKANRTGDYTISLYESDGTTAIVLADTDAVRIKISRAGTVALDIESTNDTANSSGITIDTTDPAVCTLRLAQGDLSGMQSAYDVEVLVVDDSETAPADAIKEAETGVLHVIPTAGGDIDKPT